MRILVLMRAVVVLSVAMLTAGSHQGFSAEAFDLTKNVEYASEDDVSLKCDVRVPHGEGPFPAVLCVHGGAWMTGVKEHMNHIADKLSDSGYTTVSISYRLAPKYKFPAQIEDCRAALAWMREHANEYKLDPTRVGGFGYSAGAQLVCLLGTEDVAKGEPDTRLQCVVAGGAPCDFRLIPAQWDTLAYWLGSTREKNQAIYEQASPLKFVTADDAPTFFFHGDQDMLVPKLSPQAMAFALKANKVEASVHMVPKAGHIAAFFDKDAIEASLKFLDAQLKATPESK